MLISKDCKILVDENIFFRSEFTSLNCIELTKILLFGHPDLSKNPSVSLFKHTCFFIKSITLLYLYHLHGFSLYYFVCVCAPSYFVCLCVAIISGRDLSSLAVSKYIK